MIPFTTDQFLNLFRDYNLAIWPAQIPFYLIGLAAVLAVINPFRFSGRIVSAILSFMWLWNGVGYHILNFSRINRAAYLFGLLFVSQAAILFVGGVIRERIPFALPSSKPARYAGMAAAAYAMLIYPALGAAAGHGFPFSPVFGVAPCPTTIFTLGLLVLTKGPAAPRLFIIPLAWSLIGFGAALKMGIVEDWGLLLTGAAAAAILFRRRRTAEAVVPGLAENGVRG